jgi:hypothetical protein
MKRVLTKSRLNDLENKYRVTFETEPCEAGTMESFTCQKQVLKAIVDNAGMMDCGPVFFQSLRMFHDGHKWVVELESIAA